MRVRKEIELLWNKTKRLERQINCEHQFVLSCVYTCNGEKKKKGSFRCIKCGVDTQRTLTPKEINAVRALGY